MRYSYQHWIQSFNVRWQKLWIEHSDLHLTIKSSKSQTNEIQKTIWKFKLKRTDNTRSRQCWGVFFPKIKTGHKIYAPCLTYVKWLIEGRAYKEHQICHLSKIWRAPLILTRAQPTIPHSPTKPRIPLVSPCRVLIINQRKQSWCAWVCVCVVREDLLDGSRGYEGEGGEVMGVTEGGGGLPAFVGQRECLMLYADELTFCFSERCTLSPVNPRHRCSHKHDSYTFVSISHPLLSPCLYSPRPLGTPIKQVCDKTAKSAN